uniref:Betaine--homocysteine S-methyltransferase 1-like n=1 Tax=Saccoglossus kowalevskii TaxID=10224 RepID=A0ABM0MUA0_SACKO|nr:PREDICTED: betaine--homocysteine S-methyltransferase 1-like [Saccoglossus kowalevskii]
MSTKTKGLLQRLHDGEFIICAEGYSFYFEREGYLQLGPGVPMIVKEHPELVKNSYRTFVRAGSDVVLAFTYYGHRAKLAVIGKEDLVEEINKSALRMAREVADETGTLMAGNLCNTNIYNADDAERIEQIKEMFREQVEWAVEAGADFILAETYTYYGEALLALETIKQYGKGLPAVLTLAPFVVPTKNGHAVTADKVLLSDACAKLKSAGASVVGLNCGRGPDSIIPLMKEIKDACLLGPLAAIPVPYRTTKEEPTFFMLKDPMTDKPVFYSHDTDIFYCSREDIKRFGSTCKEMGIQFVGVCCGNRPFYTCALAESLGRSPEASLYTPDMSRHYVYGVNPKVKKRRG